MMIAVCAIPRFFFFLKVSVPPRSNLTDTLFPYTTLFRSILKTQLIGDFGGRNSRVCQLPLGMHELLLVHDGDGSEAQEFLAGLTEPRGIHLQNLTIIADLQIASDFPLDKAAKARDEIERRARHRSEEHTSELQSLMRISYAVFCLKKKITRHQK